VDRSLKFYLRFQPKRVYYQNNQAILTSIKSVGNTHDLKNLGTMDKTLTCKAFGAIFPVLAGLQFGGTGSNVINMGHGNT
jgi:hypothetical protein